MKDQRTIELEIMNSFPALKSTRIKILREQMGMMLVQSAGMSTVAAEIFIDRLEKLMEEKFDLAKQKE